jgi:DUF4097 and DUF4098 domain-containing protein YvlB
MVVVERHEGALLVRAADQGRRRASWLPTTRRPRIEAHLRVPRTAGLEVRTVGAVVRTSGCHAGESVSTVTGEVDIEAARGLIDVRTVSGSARVEGSHVDVRAATTSGQLRVDGSPVDALQLRSVSGRIEIRGRLSGGGEHRVESLSGDVAVGTTTGATLAIRTISGRLVAEGTARRALEHGTATLVTGDGGVPIQVTTVSGDVRLASSTALPIAGDPEGPDPMLDALEALARGEISVEEADRRLEVLHG